MRLVRQRRDPRAIPLAEFLAALALLSALAARLLLAIPDRALILPMACPFRAMTGLPCLTCGGTRALAALARGDWSHALAFNPLVSLAALVAVAAGIACLGRRLAGSPVLRLELRERESCCLRIAAVAILMGNWAYLLLRN